MKMKLPALALCLLALAVSVIEAAPTSYNGTSNTTDEGAATSRLSELNKQYKEYVDKTLKTRKSGCTSKNILYRQEW